MIGRRTSGLVFLSTQREGRRLDYNAIQARLADPSADAHLPERILSHGLRRLFGQTIADAVGEGAAGALLGHSGNILMGITSRYVRTDTEKLAAIHAKYSPVLLLKYAGPDSTYEEWRERNKEGLARADAAVEAARAADPEGFAARLEEARHRPRRKDGAAS